VAISSCWPTLCSSYTVAICSGNHANEAGRGISLSPARLRLWIAHYFASLAGSIAAFGLKRKLIDIENHIRGSLKGLRTAEWSRHPRRLRRARP
jgi:hypothetical protein